MTSSPKIVVIGGGTGSFSVLTGLKQLDCQITALVNMIDDGGSTGQLRDEYGVLPPGDIRQCLVALSDAPLALRELFNFRFPRRSFLGGHSFGNLFISATEMMTDNFGEAIRMASEVLNIKGYVLPVTTQKGRLILEAGSIKVKGQQAVEVRKLPPGTKPKLYLTPNIRLTDDARRAITRADLVVIAPGSLYGSIIPTLIVEGMSASLKQAKAKLVYICNLVNKPHNTLNYRVTDYVSEIERFIGTGVIDFVLYNTDLPTKDLLKRYAQEGEYPVKVDTNRLKKANYKSIAGKFLSHKPATVHKDDVLLKRSLIRHDSKSIARAIANLI